MPYAIITFDKPGNAQRRSDTRERHLAYLKESQHRLLAAGAMLHDDGGTGEGGVILLDTDLRAEAEAFIAADPYTQAGLFDKVIVTRWRKAFFDGRFLL